MTPRRRSGENRRPSRRRRRHKTTEVRGAQPLSHRLGLALSGGGFRATAFHLDVLRRLRELGLLSHIDVVSTVSGGSIVGAAWVWWRQTTQSGTASEDGWSQFERSLIELMRDGLRGRVFWTVGVSSFALAGFLGAVFALAVGGDFDRTSLARAALAGLLSGVLLGYLVWHSFATRRLAGLYDHVLFRGARVSQLRAAPRLIINVTGLQQGEHLTYASPPNWRGRVREVFRVLGRIRGPRELKDERLAVAVAASSAYPLLFPPLPAQAHVPGIFKLLASMPGAGSFFAPLARATEYLVTDGGVFDNQGLRALIQDGCTRIIVSDASSSLKLRGRPSRWLHWPPEDSVLARTFTILYDRVREMGYEMLSQRQALSQLFECARRYVPKHKQGEIRQPAGGPFEGYVSVELRTSRDARPTLLSQMLARVRTDVDRFSSIEISALMYHGYTVADQCLRRFQPRWIPLSDVPAAFKTADGDTNINWTALESDVLKAYLEHLAPSHSHWFIYRCFYRLARPWVRKLRLLYRSVQREVRGWWRWSPRPQ